MKNRKTLTLFLTHSCNLNCTYCYEHFKSNQKMTFALAKEILDYEFCNMGEYDFVEVNLFGGEPFLEFSLIKDIVLYLENSEFNVPYVVFITTNGTLVHGEVQDWLKLHTNSLQCALSLDGTKECHDINRSNSFNKIDLKFFVETYPEQPVKMTISQESLPYLFECVKFAHECGFEVNCNLAFGIDWSNLDNEHILVSQLSKMCDYYIENPNISPCSLLSKKIEILGYDKSTEYDSYTMKSCGTGTDMPTYDVDGEKYGCQFFAPISLGKERAREMQNTVMTKKINVSLIEDKCRTCVIRELCPTCYGANYATTGSIYIKDENMCKLNKLTMKAVAYFMAKKWELGMLSDEYKGDKEQALIRAILAIDNMG